MWIILLDRLKEFEHKHLGIEQLMMAGFSNIISQ